MRSPKERFELRRFISNLERCERVNDELGEGARMERKRSVGEGEGEDREEGRIGRKEKSVGEGEGEDREEGRIGRKEST